MKKNKPIVGFFGISGCAGCLLSFLYEEVFLKITKKVDIRSFPLIKEDNYKGNFDFVFIEGTVVFEKDISLLNELRRRAKYVIALGSCSCFGGVPSIRNFKDGEKKIKFVYPKYDFLKSVKPSPIDKYIKVDFYIPQCPPNKKEIIDFLNCILTEKPFRLKEEPVCVECRKNGNRCLLEDNILCLGPLTLGGCNAICPQNKTGCYGCRGPFKEANYNSFIHLLKKKKYTKKEIEERMEIFAGLNFKKEEEKISKWLEQ